MNAHSALNCSIESRRRSARGAARSSRRLLAAAAALFALATPALAQTAFTPGDLVVSTYGVDGGYQNGTLQATSIDGVPTPISLEEFTTTTNGTPVMIDTLPTTDSGNNFGIVGEYGSSSEANIQLTANGQDLLIGGYQADAAIAGTGLGTGNYYSNEEGTALAQSTDTAVPRMIAVIGANGVANTSTQFNDIYSENNPRSVWSANGSLLYVSGQGSSTDQGIYTIQEGNNTVTGSPAPTPISANTSLDTRVVSAYNGNLYYSIDVKTKATGIFEYSGIPTGVAVATQLTPASGLSGNSENITVNYSPDGFYFANTTTLYVADTGKAKNKGIGDGGIQKWSLVGSTWDLDYTLTPTNFLQNYNDSSNTSTNVSGNVQDGQSGFESVTGQVVNGTVDLYAVSYTVGDSDADGLYAIADNLSATSENGETFTELATAPGIGNVTSLTAQGGEVFKAVSFAPAVSVPEPGTYAMIMGAFSGMLVVFQRRRRAKK